MLTSFYKTLNHLFKSVLDYVLYKSVYLEMYHMPAITASSHVQACRMLACSTATQLLISAADTESTSTQHSLI